MNAHTPFDANKDWSNPYCQNSSNDSMVDALLGNAYHVVRTVYCNLGNLKLIYDFLNKYGMVLGVQSETELKAMPTSATYVRLYGFDNTNKRVVTDYLYVDGDRTGVIPDDPSATGSWILVATSNSEGGGDAGDGKASPPYIPYTYNNGSAIGGETTIPVPAGTVGVPMIVIEGYTNLVGYGFTYDASALTVTLAQPLEPGDEVHLFLTGTPAVPDNPNVTDWVQINWMYNGGYAVGGEQVIAIPYTFESVPAIYKNGERYYAGLADKSYTVDAVNQRILLTEPLVTNDRLIVTIGGESTTLIMTDRTVQEVARSANVKDSEVILSTNTTQYLNGKKVVYDVVAQKIYGLPTLPTNVYINTVSDGQLTYSPGNITVDLLPVPDSGKEVKDLLASNNGANSVVTSSGGTVQEYINNYIRVFPTVAAVQSATNVLVGDTIRVQSYYAGVPFSGAEWVKTSEIAAINQHPVDLQRLAFTDNQGYVYTLVQDPMAGINIEQIGGRPYNSADLPGCDTSALWLALLNYKRTIPTNRLTINLPAREYYSSKGIPVYQWTTVRSTGKFGTQFRIAKGLWTDAEIPPAMISTVNTFWSIKSFHFSIVHPTGVHASNVELKGVDFVTNAGDSTDYGLYLPYFNDIIIDGVRNTGIDTALYYVNGYSSIFNRHIATARVNGVSTAGSWGVRSVERKSGIGCGTSLKFVECGYTDFILGWSLVGMTYTHLDTCYTEGTLSEVVGTFKDCPNLTITSYGIERLTSNRSEALIQISGGSVVINGINAAYNVSANGNIFLQVSGSCKLVANGINMKYLTNGSTTGLITTANNVEAFIGPVVYPDMGTYTNRLGTNTVMLGTGGNFTPQHINAAAANFNSITDTINTVGKFQGKGIYDRTLGCVVYASGSTPESVWRNGTGAVAYTPA